MNRPFLLPEPVLEPDDGRWIAACSYCGEHVDGQTRGDALEQAHPHHRDRRETTPPPPSDVRGPELLARLTYTDSPEHAWAAGAIEEYFTRYTGRMFERLGLVAGADPDPDTITATDLVAVSMLGVAVPPSAAIALLGPLQGRITDLLSAVPAGMLHDLPHALGRDGAAWQLWSTLQHLPGMGPTTTSKLMARKRPGLIPIHDSRVTWRLELPEAEWAYWTEWWRHPRHVDAVRSLGDARADLTDISPLRLLDVAVWFYDQSLRPRVQAGAN